MNTFIPGTHGAVELHSGWVMQAQDLSKEQLSHFSTAQVAEIRFLTEPSFSELYAFPTVNGTQILES